MLETATKYLVTVKAKIDVCLGFLPVEYTNLDNRWVKVSIILKKVILNLALDLRKGCYVRK